MGNLKIVGLGPGDVNLLTLEAYKIIENAECVYFRTAIHPVYEYFKQEKKIVSFDDLYENSEDFDEVYEAIANTLVKELDKGDIVYCVPGNPRIDDKTIFCGELANHKDYILVTGLSYVDEALNYLPDDLKNIQIINYFEFRKNLISVHSTNIITNVYNYMLVEELGLQLSEIYGDDYEVLVVFYTGERLKCYAKRMAISEMMLERDYNHQTVILVPEANGRNIYQIPDLLDIMADLRGIDGCPWDIEQDHESIKNHLIEESYEVIEAINNLDFENLEEELGDVLLQIVFHAQMADEEGYFGFNNVVQGISEKLIRRHPHVFLNQDDISVDDVSLQWEKIKNDEKKAKNYTESLINISKVLPSLLKSYKIQKKVSKVGFDWDSVDGPIEKLKEELGEFIIELKANSFDGMKEEIGDLLFTIVNVCRFIDINPEEALNMTNDKFVRRFGLMEEKIAADGLKIEELALETMDKYWEASKL